ncbi:UbiX family flavin prenyltransferase [Streptomyces sp. URMC 126]|uniref:UbiX family flavin prenyltransferase n=1 Tax=Streptomyces sp. URMC 126 TaxID=3423401 RepID=UPI003F1B97DD
MVIAPCSMNAMKPPAGYPYRLRRRPGDPRRRRGAQGTARTGAGAAGTPLSEIRLENMPARARVGVRIVPPVPAFYNHRESFDGITARALNRFGLPAPAARRRQGMRGARRERPPPDKSAHSSGGETAPSYVR